MKKSARVPASLVVAIAAGLAASGCNRRNEMGQCVDAQGRVLPEYDCRNNSRGARWIPSRGVQSGGFGGFGGSSSFFGG